MGGQVARGELPTPDPDDEAAKYELADVLLSEAGYAWYEISNFARTTDADLTSGRHVLRARVGAQPCLLARLGLVGPGPRGAFPRGVYALVERQEPRRVRRTAARWAFPCLRGGDLGRGYARA